MLRFDGAIAGVGTSSGVRVVLGMWTSSPFGPVADAMIERADGHRILLAPSDEVADLVAGTYGFDEVRIEPVTLHIAGSVRTFGSTSLSVTFETGGRTPVGRVLSFVPRRLARNRRWCALIDPVARLVRRGVRTVGSAGNGRREWYCAMDEHRIVSSRASLDDVDLGALRPVEPAVAFGFASTPPAPALVRVTTWIE